MPDMSWKLTREEQAEEMERIRRAGDPAGESRRRAEEELVKAEARDGNPPAQGSLAQRRQKEAVGYARGLLRALAGSPVLRTGQALEPDEIKTLVADVLEDENLPASLRADVKATATRIVEMVAGGNRHDADQLARAEAIALGERLARSSWSGPADDDFDPQAVVRNIPRI